jgi:hypothetical protein
MKKKSMPLLVDYAKKGLRNCYMRDRQCWSFIYHLDGRAEPNEAFPEKDIFYSLNVILGFASLGRESWEGDYDLPALLHHNAAQIFNAGVPVYAIGMALWASAELNVPLQPEIMKKIEDFIRNRSNWNRFRAQDAGMILTGLSEQKFRGNNNFDDEARDLFKFIEQYYLSPSHLFFDGSEGMRRNFSSFATQTYLTTACYHYGRRFHDDKALAIADASVTKLISLQGSSGVWPWFYFPRKGIVVDNYEIYSVHQIGMAALFLEFAEKRNVPGAHDALVKGFNWIFCNNQLNQNMMIPELGMFYRSIIRKGEHTDRLKRARRAVVNSMAGRPDIYDAPENLTLRLECRSYELGWVLYSFGNRTDLQAIIENPAFAQAA